MIVEREDNSALYFIVGGLLVAAVAFAIYYFKDNSEPQTVAETPTISRTEPAAGNTNSTSLSVDNNGVKATTTTSE